MSDAGGLPDDEVTPQDIVSHASGVNTTKSKAFLQTARKAYLKAASKRARQEAEMALLKKKLDLELSLAEMEADAQLEQAETARQKAEQEAKAARQKAEQEVEAARQKADLYRRKAERDRRRRQAEIELLQINAISKIAAKRAQKQVLGEMKHENRSAVSRIKWKAHLPSDDLSRSLTMHSALGQTRFPVIAEYDDQVRATTVKLNLETSILTGTSCDQMVSPLMTTNASQHFDDRDNLLTDAEMTPDTGQFASTLPNRVNDQPTLISISSVIPATNQ